MDTSAHRVLFGARHRADGLIMNWWITYAAAIVAWYVGGPLLSLAVWVALVAKALWDRQEAINARLSRLTREPTTMPRRTSKRRRQAHCLSRS